MPGSMIHLTVARKLRPQGSPLFFLGSIAPDAVDDREIKDKTHFRLLPDRMPALRVLSEQTKDDFSEGILLHLYTDMKWDEEMISAYRERAGENWFLPYRRELSYCGSYAYVHEDWAKAMWLEMASVPTSEYGKVPGATAEDLADFVCRNAVWLENHSPENSSFFTPEMVERFTDTTVMQYISFRTNKNG